MTEKKKKPVTVLLMIILILMLCVMTLSVVNIYKLRMSGASNADMVESTTVENEYKNSLYKIGNNATDVNKKYFKELNTAVKSDDRQSMAEAVVKCFVSEYYTWTNKDGNYDIGGMQYIYPDRQNDFATYSRDNFYSSMDNYLHSNERFSLIEVDQVSINSCESSSINVMNANNETITYPSYVINASWTYVSGSVMNTTNIQSSASFTMIDHDGRIEIASIQ